jgi:two-component system, OmpR family, sensor histidine kinase KdpD
LRAHEAAFIASAVARLLEPGGVQRELREIASELAGLLGAARASVEVDSLRKPDEDETAYDLTVGGRNIGRLYLDAGAGVDAATIARLVPALASLLAVTADRERLDRRAVEAETLRRSDVVKTAILRAVSHDLRSPLTAIRAAAEGLQSRSFELGADDQAAPARDDQRRDEEARPARLQPARPALLESGTAAPRPEVWTLDGLVGRALDALGIAQANGCRLWAESPPGSGATFVLALPRVEVPAGATA